MYCIVLHSLAISKIGIGKGLVFLEDRIRKSKIFLYNKNHMISKEGKRYIGGLKTAFK